jgi:Cu/Ag efflux protein CusF
VKRFLVALLVSVFAGVALAQHNATGVVTKPPANGKVTIKHDPVPSLKWPGMTMSFVVKDKAVADKLKPGAKIEFEFVQQGKDYVVTSVK